MLFFLNDEIEVIFFFIFHLTLKMLATVHREKLSKIWHVGLGRVGDFERDRKNPRHRKELIAHLIDR